MHSAFRAFEDKVAQRAIVMLLEPIYEQDFLDCSFGFRPVAVRTKRCKSLRDGIWSGGGRWVLDVDVRKYFDSIDRAKLRELSGQTSHRWCGQKADRQVAQSGCAGSGAVVLPRRRVRHKVG